MSEKNVIKWFETLGRIVAERDNVIVSANVAKAEVTQ